MRVLVACLLVLSGATAFAQDVPTHLRGTIEAVDGALITLAEPDGSKTKLRLTPEVRIDATVKASLADVTQGTLVGVANTGPNGLQDALEVHILPAATGGGKTGLEQGQTRWDLGKRGSRMTIGTARGKTESYDGQNLTIGFNSDEATIQVRPNTPVVRIEPGGAADLKPGAGIFVRDGERQPDGSVLTDAIIVGRTAKPPM